MGSLQKAPTWLKILSGRSNRRNQIAPYSRHLAWDAIFSFIKRYWVVLIVTSLLPPLMEIPVLLFMKGNTRWVFIGIFSVSGLWFTSILIVLGSGAADKIMGLEYERMTADSLKTLKKRGWKILNGVQIRNKADIDHLLIGPGGVFVLETKWSANEWVTKPGEKGFKYLQKPTWQVKKNYVAVKENFSDFLDGIPVKPVCVLWSATKSSYEKYWSEHEGITLVPGSKFEEWLNSLSANILSNETIDLLCNEIVTADKNFKLEHSDQNKYGNLTILNFLYRYFIFPLLVLFLLLIIPLVIINIFKQ